MQLCAGESVVWFGQKHFGFSVLIRLEEQEEPVVLLFSSSFVPLFFFFVLVFTLSPDRSYCSSSWACDPAPAQAPPLSLKACGEKVTSAFSCVFPVQQVCPVWHLTEPHTVTQSHIERVETKAAQCRLSG